MAGHPLRERLPNDLVVANAAKTMRKRKKYPYR
jgi:hypothetical protein